MDLNIIRLEVHFFISYLSIYKDKLFDFELWSIYVKIFISLQNRILIIYILQT